MVCLSGFSVLDRPTTIMHWLYTSTAIIAPPQRLVILDVKLRFEIAFLEFHMHFGNMEHRERLARLRTDVHRHLCSDRNGQPPPQFFIWLLNMYTGKEPFPEKPSRRKGEEVKYREAVSIEGRPCTHGPGTEW